MSFPPIYFGPSDPIVAPWLSVSQFDRFLVDAIFFEGNVVIPDAFWFCSDHLARIVSFKGDGPCHRLLVEALKEGAALPCFRDPSNSDGSFETGLAAVREDDILSLRDDAPRLARSLDAVRREAKGIYAFKHWPKDDVSKEFSSSVHDLLKPDRPIEGEVEIARWTRMREWREECLDRATKNGSVKRGDLITEVARSKRVDWPAQQRAAPFASVLNQIGDPETKEDFSCFMMWVTECYQVNQAKRFQSDPLVYAGEGHQQLGILPGLSASQGASDLQILRIELLIPTIEEFLNKPKEALSVRNSGVGQGYFDKIVAWKGRGKEVSKSDVMGAARRYAASLCDAMGTTVQPIEVTLWKAVNKTIDPDTRFAVRTILRELAGEKLVQIGEAFGVIIRRLSRTPKLKPPETEWHTIRLKRKFSEKDRCNGAAIELSQDQGTARGA